MWCKCCDVALVDLTMRHGLDGEGIINHLKQGKKDIYIVAMSWMHLYKIPEQANIFYCKLEGFKYLSEIIDSRIKKI